MASRRRNMFYKNNKQETTEIAVLLGLSLMQVAVVTWPQNTASIQFNQFKSINSKQIISGGAHSSHRSVSGSRTLVLRSHSGISKDVRELIGDCSSHRIISRRRFPADGLKITKLRLRLIYGTDKAIYGVSSDEVIGTVMT
ncbi:hypothetical protein AAG570_010679 [Ranatra chinensis]|uniref:Uncharacterized protein n=1 Tax=Ranatra chinensis TaxID=642074 RepID=A0ABD0Z1A9_9HEMI